MEASLAMEHDIKVNTDPNVLDIKGQKFTAGPLNLNRYTKQANTIMGTELVLGENDFEALDLLVSNEGKYLSFQQLYEAAWSKSDYTDSIDTSYTALHNLIMQVNNAGERFMWIEKVPGTGYIFKTRWGQNWNEPIDVNPYSQQETTSNSPANTKIKQMRYRQTRNALLTGAGVLVAALILVLILLYTTGVITPTATEPLYIDIEDPNIPLASIEQEDSS